ncbi:uncharacterized protein LOC114293205 [Camellia sinensis]|uniref:uncharacterized protein LOC114293205 n=1 Tax=Camellia sinensis TaxID=4442 RepID=UPI0010365CC1|nr:uncharacterized protein LOC114293205 [Camellia sinensis]
MRQGRVSALIPSDTRNTEAVVSSTITICNQDAFVLIDSGSTHSFMSRTYVSRFNRPIESLPYLLCVFALSGESVLCASVYRVCDMHIGSATLYVDILGLFGHDEFIFMGNGGCASTLSDFSMKACKLLKKGCQGYLCSVMTEQPMNVELDSIPVVREFPDVFPNGLLGELVDREI